MERNIKCKPTNLCMIIFMLCLSVRFVEYFLIETDKTAIGENVLHKVVGIGNFSPAGQSRTFGNLYQQFFFNWLTDEKYRLRFLSIMRTVQYRQCMDGGRCFSRSVS